VIARAAPRRLPVVGVGVGVVAVWVLAAVASTNADRAPSLTLLLGLVTAAALAVIAWHADPAWTLSLGAAATMFSGNWALLGFPIGPDRLVLVFGVIAVALRAPGLGRRAPLRLQFVHVLLVLAALYAILSAVWAGTTDTASVYALLDRFGIVPFLVFLVAPFAFRTARQRAILIGTLVAVGLYLSLTAIAESVGLTAFVFPGYITDPNVGIHFGRSRGPFVEASANGLAIVMCGAAAAVALTCWRGRWRLVAWATLALCALGILLTLTRSAWIAAILGAALAMLAARRLRRYLLPALAGLVVVLAVALATVPALSSNIQSRAADESPVWDRRNMVTAAVGMIDERPLVGFGWATFAAESPDYFRQADTYPQQGEGLVVHNVYLLYAAQLGLLGVFLWAAAFGLAVLGPILARGDPQLYAWRIGLVAVGTSWAVVAMFAPLSQAFPNLMVLMWAGIVAAGVPWLSASTEGLPQEEAAS
jgi:putative inorganic carbon (hco3(-)) transporter